MMVAWFNTLIAGLLQSTLLSRRRLCQTLAILLAFGSMGFAAASHAAYPDKPIRIIVPYPAGGATDQFARALVPALVEILKQPVIVDNRAGAGGAIGTQAVISAAPDGYTLVFGNSGPISILPLMRKLPFDPLKDLRPISLVAISPSILAVPTDSPAKDLREFVALAKRDGSKLNYGSVGNGSQSHLAGEFFKMQSGTELTHVPYKGGAPLMTAFGTGEVQMAFVTGIDAAAMVKAGKMRLLAVATEQRSPVVPGLPAVNEQVPGYVASAWFGLMAPSGVPDDIVATLNAAIVQAVSRPEFRDLLFERNVEAKASTPAQFDALIRSEMKLWGEVILRGNIKE